MAGENQLTGWKAIADFLGTSVRSAMRWERERALPIRRLPGEGKDFVFAFREEIEDWRRSDPARASGGATGTSPSNSGPPGVSEADGAGPRGGFARPTLLGDRRRLLVTSGGILVLLGLALCAAWIMGWPGRVQAQPGPDAQRRPVGARASEEPAPVVLPVVRLDVSKPDGWRTTIDVHDGGAAQIGPSADHPAVILRPRIAKGVLMLEIARADGRPVKDGAAASQPFVLVLDPNVAVQVRQPFRFSVRWVSGEASPK